MTQHTNELLPMPEQEVAAFKPYRAELAELKAANQSLVFDYESKKGNAEARSYVAKLRRTKTAVDDFRASKKRYYLDAGKLIDTEAKEIIAEVQDMIDVHADALQAIEDREKNRIAGIKAKIDGITSITAGNVAWPEALAWLLANPIDESFAEFQEEAVRLHAAAVIKVKAGIAEDEKRAADAAELERLRKLQEENERREREAKEAADREAREKEIAQHAEAAAKEAQRIAEEQAAEATRLLKAEQERAEAARLLHEEQDRIRARQDAAAEANRIAFAAQAEKDKEAAVEAAKQDERRARDAEEQERVQAENKRLKDKSHRQAIHDEAAKALLKIIKDPVDAKAVIELIAANKIPHVKIVY